MGRGKHACMLAWRALFEHGVCFVMMSHQAGKFAYLTCGTFPYLRIVHSSLPFVVLAACTGSQYPGGGASIRYCRHLCSSDTK